MIIVGAGLVPAPRAIKLRVARHEAAIPIRGNAILTHRNAIPTPAHGIPMPRNAIPTARNSIPTARNAIPPRGNGIPTARNGIPTVRNTMLTVGNDIPDHRNAIPNRRSAIPDRRNGIPMPRNKMLAGGNVILSREHLIPCGAYCLQVPATQHHAIVPAQVSSVRPFSQAETIFHPGRRFFHDATLRRSPSSRLAPSLFIRLRTRVRAYGKRAAARRRSFRKL
jgi:hypothetical protein